MTETLGAERRIRERLELLRRVLDARGPADQIQNHETEPYFVRPLVEQGMEAHDAIALAQDPLTLYLALQLRPFGLEAILADRYATEGLRKAVLAGSKPVLKALFEYAQSEKPKGKRGPRPKDGKYQKDSVLELREARLSLRKIAKEVYGDEFFHNRVSAILAQEKRKSSAPSSRR